MSTTKQLSEIIKISEGKSLKTERTEGYLRADERFKGLISKGMTEKRGYRLMTPDKAHLKKVHFNIN